MIDCPKCKSKHIQKAGKYKEMQRYRCMKCKKMFNYGKYENADKNFYIEHFGVKIKNDNLKINRDTYAIINKVKSYKTPEFIIEYFKANEEERKKIYEDIDCKIYTDTWCKKYQKDCLINYDYNMKYFDSLNKKDFDKKLKKLLKKVKNIKEINNLNDCKDMIGIYILVLDDYKQVYIGQSTTSIKKRIMSHWNRKKEFDKLIFGKVENSIISIDSFRPLDTTRIFVYPTDNVYEIEEKLVAYMDQRYLLNRTSGGIHGKYALLEASAERKERKFKIK